MLNGKKHRAINGHSQGKIYKIALNSTPKEELLRNICTSLEKRRLKAINSRGIVITTPNPEIINMSQYDILLYNVLASSDICLVDAIGLAQATKYLSLSSPKNIILKVPVLFFQGIYIGLMTFINRKWIESITPVIPGREFFMDLIKLANKRSWKVVLLGDSSAVDAQKVIKARFKKVELLSFKGPWLNKNALTINEKQNNIEKEIIAKIADYKPDMLFVGFGAPKQEKWINIWRSKLDVGLFMTVGRTFEFISGKSKRAPNWVSKLGLEWLWRLLTGSTSLVRIFNAFLVFPLRVCWYKLTA